MSITERSLSHVAQSNGSLAGRVNEKVTLLWVEFASRDHFGELLHVGRFDINNIEGLIGDLHMPQVDAEVVGGQVRLSIRVDGD